MLHNESFINNYLRIHIHPAHSNMFHWSGMDAAGDKRCLVATQKKQITTVMLPKHTFSNAPVLQKISAEV